MSLTNFSAFTAKNGAVENINELLFTTAYGSSDVAKLLNVQLGVEQGKHIGWLDNIGHSAKAGRGCNPEYASATPKGFEKVWNLGDYSTALEFCADDWKSTIARYALQKGTKVEDLEPTEIFTGILLPLFKKSKNQALNRIVYFGDTSADEVSDGGVIKNGTDLDLIKVTDGVFKLIATLIASNPSQKTAISANSQSTYALQKSTLQTSGVAIGIIEDILMNADARIQANGGVLYMTNSMYQALRRDYIATYKQTMPFEKQSEGFALSKYDGVDIAVMLDWDYNINEFENDGTKWNNPHRVIFTNPKNILVGTEDSKLLSDAEFSFDARTRTNLYYDASNIGVLLGEDDLIHVAY